LEAQILRGQMLIAESQASHVVHTRPSPYGGLNVHVPDDDFLLQLYRRWWLAQQRAEHTVQEYIRNLTLLRQRTGTPLLELNRMSIEDFILSRSEAGRSTGCYAHRAVRAFYKWAHQQQ